MDKKNRQLPTLIQSFLVLGTFLTMACSFTTVFGLPVLLALFFGWFLVIALGLKLGYRYRELEEAAAFGIFEGMPALLILFAVGAMIGSWIAGGIVPGIIYYGLATIHPSFFLPTTLFICSLTALATGTSWGAAGTTGIAMMGIGEGLGIPAPLTAGAVLSGVYFGDKLSPLSDSVLLASSMAGVEIRAHIKGLLPISLSAYLITAILFTCASLSFQGQGNLEHINMIMTALDNTFYITPIAFLPPLMVMLLLAFRQPAFPVISFGSFLGIVTAIFLQGSDVASAITSIWELPALSSGIDFIDSLLSRGGMLSIMPSVAMITFGLGFGSLLVKVGIVKLLARKMEQFVTNEARLTGCTILTAFLGNLLGSAMYVSLILAPKLMTATSDALGADRRLLSRNTEFGGTLTSGMVPWSDNGTFMAGILGVSTLSYLPFMWLSWISIALALGVSCVRTWQGKTTTFSEDGQISHLTTNSLLTKDTTH
ncbi:Na+/H+ antiporter NhaC [Parendozoicomonas sp. Alg238-R29]|uniref:Na+/H+ antiporter NhaC n=1 Tax=Parendozoicomonas sp. Alg238-R29 TaxID=2993446 RepID=UPI00248E7B2A|nr:Na+/H+ antiporter NhaC [Parendozoicomonas sp. Alg238-R29]